MGEEPKKTLVPSRHRASLARLRADRWLGSSNGGVHGATAYALYHLGVAEWAYGKGGRRIVARLTPLGVRWLELYDPEWAAKQAENGEEPGDDRGD